MTEYLQPMRMEPQDQANRAFLDELVAWRADFGLSAGEGADRCAAYLLRLAFEEHLYGWREEAGRLRHELGAAPNPRLLLALRATEKLLLHLEQEPPTPEILASASRHRELVSEYLRGLEGGRGPEVRGIPDEHLPEWYFLAHPRNAWFRDTWPDAT